MTSSTDDLHSIRSRWQSARAGGRPEDFRVLRDRVRRQPAHFGSFPGELHTFLMNLYESTARADGNAEGFAKALAHLCATRGIARWEDFVSDEQQRRFFKDGRDPLAQRIIAFWSEWDDPLAFRTCRPSTPVPPHGAYPFGRASLRFVPRPIGCDDDRIHNVTYVGFAALNRIDGGLGFHKRADGLRREGAGKGLLHGDLPCPRWERGL